MLRTKVRWRWWMRRLPEAAGILLLAGLILVSCAQYRSLDRGAQESPVRVQQPASPVETAAGRRLFLKNCAHCHGSDARGDEGPDLHGLIESDEWITHRIRNGVKGEMTAFGDKLSDADIGTLIAYLRALK